MPISRGSLAGNWSQESSKVSRGSLAGNFSTESTGGGLTVSATGVSGTGSVGTLGVLMSFALSLSAALGAVGTLAPGITVAASGVAATGQTGTLTYVALSAGGGGGGKHGNLIRGGVWN